MPSLFPNKVDTFKKHYDPPISKMGEIARYEYLRSKVNKSAVELREYEQLATSLAPYIFTTEELNMMQDAMVNMQTYFLNNTVKQLEQWKNELDVRVGKFSYKGMYSPSLTYQKENIVGYNNALYIVKVDSTVGVVPTDQKNWNLMMPSLKGDKGDKGDPGANLIIRGMWRPSTEYQKDNVVNFGSQLFACTTPHTSTQTFDASKFMLLIDVNNMNMSELAFKLGFKYRLIQEPDGDIVERIVKNMDTANPFGDHSKEEVVLSCTMSVVDENGNQKIYYTYKDPSHLLSPKDNYVIVTVVGADGGVVTYEQ